MKFDKKQDQIDDQKHDYFGHSNRHNINVKNEVRENRCRCPVFLL